jgi:hypothetical protein
MNVVLGLKAHSGWAALVIIGKTDSGFVVAGRQRIELVDEAWAKQPYHAAENLEPSAARKLVKRGISAAHKKAGRELKTIAAREVKRGNTIVACAVVVTNPMPSWSIDEILAVHFRMHKAEGVLFREALLAGAGACGLEALSVPEQSLESELKGQTQMSSTLAAMGKLAGPPWGKDQKEAALAAIIALRNS